MVQSWLKKGIKMSYPMLMNKKYYKSEDGLAFIENGDKYVIPLSNKEVTLYTRSPETFKKDFLMNVKIYVEFINWLHELQPKTNSLEPKQKFISLLLILYLFQRGMDHHYYHFDRYLAYQNYPDTPVGYWWRKLKKICQILTKNNDENIILLHMLSNDEEAKKLKKTLNEKQKLDLDRILKNIKIFETTQEAEVRIVIDFKTKENVFSRTAMPIWNELSELLKRFPNILRKEHQEKIPEIINGHPLIVTRIILSPEGLNYLQADLFNMFESEIKRWI